LTLSDSVLPRSRLFSRFVCSHPSSFLDHKNSPFHSPLVSSFFVVRTLTLERPRRYLHLRVALPDDSELIGFIRNEAARGFVSPRSIFWLSSRALLSDRRPRRSPLPRLCAPEFPTNPTPALCLFVPFQPRAFLPRRPETQCEKFLLARPKSGLPRELPTIIALSPADSAASFFAHPAIVLLRCSYSLSVLALVVQSRCSQFFFLFRQLLMMDPDRRVRTECDAASLKESPLSFPPRTRCLAKRFLDAPSVLIL